jgi:hypothetical protein
VQPRLDVAARPHTTAGVLCFALDRFEFSLGTLWPVNCVAVADQPFAEIDIANRTRRHGAPVLVQRDRNAGHGLLGNEGVKIVRCLRPAAILQAVLATTKLTAFRGVDAPQPNACPVNFQGVAIDYACLTREVVGRSWMLAKGSQR